MSSDDLPDPLVPAEVDLSGFATMPLDVQLLRDSRFAAEVEPEAFRAGVLLWCASWHQVPAGSLPANDRELSTLAGFGRVVKEWLKVRDEALQLFVLCNDGRLYHRIVSEKANAAWRARLEHFYERARERLRKANKARAQEKPPRAPLPELTFDEWNERRLALQIPPEKCDAATDVPPEGVGFPPERGSGGGGIPAENALKGEGEGEGKNKGRAAASPAPAPAPAPAHKPEGLGSSSPSALAPPAGPPGSLRAAEHEDDPAAGVVGFEPTRAGRACRAMKAAGVVDVNPGHPDLLLLLDQGVTEAQFQSHAVEARTKGKGFAWVLATIAGRKRDADEKRETAKAARDDRFARAK